MRGVVSAARASCRAPPASSTINSRKGSVDSRSACGPSKKGLLVVAQRCRLASRSPVTPARNAMTMPAMAPPAMYPDANSTPGPRSVAAENCASSSARMAGSLRALRSTKWRISPPMKIGVVEEMGQIHAHGEGQRGHAGNFHQQRDHRAEEDQIPGQFAIEDALDDVGNQRGLRRIEFAHLRAIGAFVVHAVDARVHQPHRLAAVVDQILSCGTTGEVGLVPDVIAGAVFLRLRAHQ